MTNDQGPMKHKLGPHFYQPGPGRRGGRRLLPAYWTGWWWLR